jgi:hypothetical protein
MATTERPPNRENATSDAQPIVEQGRGEPPQSALTTPSRHPRWRPHRTRTLLELAKEADMFVWEKVRLRGLRDDLAADAKRRDARERNVHLGEAPNGAEGGLALVDFERDSWPH